MIITSPYHEISRKSGLVVLEGVNGAGKSTISSHCVDFLNSRNISNTKTFEPGDSPLGKQIREIVLGDKRVIANQLSELFLFEADRAEHVQQVIKPSLQENKIVICDRYTYSTTAFQGYGRGIDLTTIENLNEIAVAGIYPDIVILLDLDPADGLTRNKKGARTGDSFAVDALEHEEIEFHRRIRKGFLEIAQYSKEHFIVIDASKSLTSVTSEIERILKNYLNLG